MSSIIGQLDPLTIKIFTLPDAHTVENGWQEFTVNIGTAIVTVTVRPRIWRNLVEGSKQYPHWMAIIIGKMGELTDTGFVLEQPGIQIFEASASTIEEKQN